MKNSIPHGFDLKIATHNVHTLCEGTERGSQNVNLLPEQYKEIGAHIVGVQETRRYEVGRVHLPDSGYTFIWNGKEHGQRTHGVGFMISDEFSEEYVYEVINISDRCIVLKLPIEKTGENSSSKHVWIVNMYAPHEGLPLKEKEQFYDMLEEKVWKNIPKDDYTIGLGDMNACTGKRNEETSDGSVMGSFGMNQRNVNGEMLLQHCRSHNLCLVNSYFRKRKGQGTFKFQIKNISRHQKWRRLDYIMIDRSELRNVTNCEVVDIVTTKLSDHNIVVCDMKLKCHLKRKKYEQRTKRNKVKRIDRTQLSDEVKRCEFITKTSIQVVVASILHTRETKQSLIKEIISKAQAKILSDEELLKRKRAHIQAFLNRIKGPVFQAKIKDRIAGGRRLENEPINIEHAEEYLEQAHKLGIEVFGERPRNIRETDWYSKIKPDLQKYINERKRLWNLVKSIKLMIKKQNGKGVKKYATVLKAYREAQKEEESKNMRRLADDIDIQERWVHHFKNLLNIKKTVDPNIFDSLHQYDIDNTLAEEPTMEEMEIAMTIMKNDKATGEDEISIEELRVHKEANPKAMLEMFCQVWRKKKIPQNWKDIHQSPYLKIKDRASNRGIIEAYH